MEALVRHYLNTEPAEDTDTLLGQYAEALWIEERQTNVLAGALAKALGGKR